MMRVINTLLLFCSLAVCVAIVRPAPARADDGSQPTTIVDDGSTDTDVPVPPGVTDPDAGSGNGGGNAPSSNPQPGNPGEPSDTPTTTTTVTTTPPPPKPRSCEVNPSADIGVIAKADAGQYTAGSMVSYSLDAFDNDGHGECDAAGAVLTFQVAPQLELLSPSYVSTDTGTCEVTGGVGNQLVTCSFGTLQPDQHAHVMVEARADAVGTANSVAGVSTTVSDSNVGDNQQSTATVQIVALPDQSAAHQRMSQPRETVRSQGLLWDGRTFRSTDAFAGWLSARGGNWERFEANHPAAAAGLNDRG